MSNGTQSSVSNLDWDIAFEINGQTASVLINSKNMATLYRPVNSVANWSAISYADTLASMVAGNELFNHDTAWGMGAFNRTYNPADPFDLGWGNYNFATHQVIGDSVYFIRLSNGAVKKMYIESLTAGIYTFKYANPDGSNEIIGSINKSNYIGKNFAYYSMVNNIAIDREPLNSNWDLVFTQYLSVDPITYMVGGVLSNKNVLVEKAYPVDVNSATYNATQFSHFTNAIGYNWKYFDMNTFSWVIEDSLAFFVRDVNYNIYKMIFTGFGGAASGKFYFTKEYLALATPEQEQALILECYPNPASTSIHFSLYTPSAEKNTKAILFDMSARKLIEQNFVNEQNFLSGQLDVSSLANGVYILQIHNGYNIQSKKIIIEK